MQIKRRLRHVLVYLQNKEKISDIILLYSKYAYITNGSAYCLKYHNTKPQLHYVECDDHGFPHKGRGLQFKRCHDIEKKSKQDNAENQRACKSVPKCY